VKGDLGDFDCGNGTGTVLTKVKARTTGAYGLATQGGAGDLVWNLNGAVDSIKVAGDVKDTRVNVSGALGALTVEGSLIGGEDDFSGAITSAGGIGPVKIARDIIGGAGMSSGLVSSDGVLTSVADRRLARWRHWHRERRTAEPRQHGAGED
jgi:hypothetical protein